MDNLANLIEEDLLATFPPVEEMERRNEAYLVKIASGVPLVEGVDYGFPRE